MTDVRTFKPGEGYDTREHLRNAAAQARARGYDQLLIVDVDAHHYESESWAEIVSYIEDPVIRHEGGGSTLNTGGGLPLLGAYLGNQDVAGRVVRYRLRRREATPEGEQRDVAIIHRAMDAIGIDYQIVFPSPMLQLGLHPRQDVEVALARAYARWLTERVLSRSDRLRTMLYLPFNDPGASLRMIEEFGEARGVVGFMCTAVRYRPVHDNAYMPVYRALEERGLPLGFHAGYAWQGSQPMELFNRFLSVHALGFTFFNMIHLTNWIVNGLPERFPNLDVVWIESGLAWLPFLMQRLDQEYRMRSSEAPLLKRLPSEYIRDMYFTSQPMERPDDMSVLETTFRMIDAENHLLYSSDYPHWDFDLPSVIYDLPFLSEAAKRKILGENARRLFKLP